MSAGGMYEETTRSIRNMLAIWTASRKSVFCPFACFTYWDESEWVYAVLLWDVEYRDSVFPGRLHADILHTVLFQPEGHAADIAVHCCKLPDVKVALSVSVSVLQTAAIRISLCTSIAAQTGRLISPSAEWTTVVPSSNLRNRSSSEE
ncbi:hypothetical protein C823_007528 [Eubacterium plexicaudatum ASF492]|nr:hypothetical protein C823_007528 [Eubacterium plexicaudatum ASF492]